MYSVFLIKINNLSITKYFTRGILNHHESLKMNNLSLEKTGKPLQSIKADKTGLIELSDEGKAMWDSFVKKGIAIKISEKKYRFKKK